jgi:hypothetical protein
MSKDMKDFVESCEECSRRNHTKAFKRGLTVASKSLCTPPVEKTVFDVTFQN